MWAYLALMMNIRGLPFSLGPLMIAMLTFSSQILGYQGIMTMYWIPALALSDAAVQPARMTLKPDTKRRVACTVALAMALGMTTVPVNVNHAMYKWTQIPFQVSCAGRERSRSKADLHPSLPCCSSTLSPSVWCTLSTRLRAARQRAMSVQRRQSTWAGTDTSVSRLGCEWSCCSSHR